MQAQKMDAVGRLAGGVAHDFNNMLSVILGYSETLLRKMEKDDPRGGVVGQIVKAGDRAARLVRQLLAFSRRQITKPIRVDLNELVISMTKMLRLLVGESVELVALPSTEGTWTMKIDPGQLEQVLANLVVNARDAMPGGGKVVIGTKNAVIDEAYASKNPGMKTGEFAVLWVQDTGTGMTEEVQKKIFEPFFTTKEKGKGTGLGLATCYGVVKQAGGYVEVDSKLGEGTTFKLYFPRVEGKPENVTAQEGPTSLPRGSETVLLVEDEDLVRDLVCRLLEDQGYHVIVAENGSQAVRLAEENRDNGVDLLLTDVVMPNMGGREVAERFLKIFPNGKTLFMSGYVDDDTVQSSAEDESLILLHKPITPTALAFKVREVLDPKKS